MSLRSDAATTRDTGHALRIFVLEVALAGLGCAAPQLALAQDVPAFAPGMINHMQQMKRFKDVDHGQQPTPPVIPRFRLIRIRPARLAPSSPMGQRSQSTMRSSRISGPMAEPASAATSRKMAGAVSAADVAKRFAASGGTDPIFRLVDGATCPSDDVSNFAAKQQCLQAVDRPGIDSDRPAGAGGSAIRRHGRG